MHLQWELPRLVNSVRSLKPMTIFVSLRNQGINAKPHEYDKLKMLFELMSQVYSFLISEYNAHC